MRTWIWLIFILTPLNIQGQIITTYAGTGSTVFSGEGVPATSAGIPNPNGIVFDKQGNCFFVDGLSSYRIRKITPAGIISTVAGIGVGGFSGDGGPASAAKLGGGGGIDLDTAGNIYFADPQNNRIRKIDKATGIITTIAGNGVGSYSGDGGPATAAGLYNPQDVRVDTSGNVYIAAFWNNRIRKIDASGIITTIAGGGTSGVGDGGPATSAQLVAVSGVDIDKNGNVYLAENNSSPISNRVRVIDNFGLITTVAGNGAGIFTGDGIAATAASISPYFIAFDTSGQIFISDRGNLRVYRVDHSGILHTVVGDGSSMTAGDGGPATAASIWDPTYIAFDPCNNLYISEAGGPGSRRIRKVTFNPGSISSVTITCTPNDTVCAGTPVTFTTTTTGASTMTFQWYKNGDAVAGATSESYTFTPAMGDSVRCVYTGVDICSFTGHPSSNMINMVVTPLTPPTIALGSTPSSSAAIGSTVTVNAAVGSAGSSYTIKWYKNAVPFGITSVPVTTYVKGAGADVITAKVSSTDPLGCYDTTTSAGITINTLPGGVNDVQTIMPIISLYPNPAADELYVIGEATSYRILNAVGQVLQQGQIINGAISIANFAPGVYMLEASDADGLIICQRFVKN